MGAGGDGDSRFRVVLFEDVITTFGTFGSGGHKPIRIYFVPINRVADIVLVEVLVAAHGFLICGKIYEAGCAIRCLYVGCSCEKKCGGCRQRKW